MRSSYFLLCIFTLVSCSSKQTSTSYNFPNKTVIKEINDDTCFDGWGERGIGNMSNIEEQLLDFAGSVSISEQQKYGKEYHQSLREHYRFIDDERLKKLERILRKMLPHTENQRIKYSIYLIEDKKQPDMLNAFTHVGGYIYVTSKLMEFVDSEDELAFIIGHEIGHNENEHVLRVLKRSKLIKPLANDFSDQVAGVVSLLLTSYNQIQELESDRAGAYLAYKAGYDPQRGLDFFQKLSKYDNENVLNTLTSSHPYSSRRKDCTHQYLENSKE